jgi:hypothetical protein
MQHMQTIQKLLKASIEDLVPAKNAKAFVSDVIVIEGPAWARACFILVEAGNFREAWSKALQMTNMSSTPIPSIRTGIVSCISVLSHPSL